MALFNYATKEITLKIVYYGPGLSGKTTNLQHLHAVLNPETKGKLLSLSTEADRTLFFDFLPIEIGKIRDFSIRFQLYTVPGQVRYNATRKVVLKGADAVVFVADSQKAMREQNIESFDNMRENLISNNIKPDSLPLILQYNKRDLSNILAREELDRDLNPNSLYEVREASAINGSGVEDTFKSISRSLLKDIARKHKVEIHLAEDKEEAPVSVKRPLQPAIVPEIRIPTAEPSRIDIPATEKQPPESIPVFDPSSLASSNEQEEEIVLAEYASDEEPAEEVMALQTEQTFDPLFPTGPEMVSSQKAPDEEPEVEVEPFPQGEGFDPLFSTEPELISSQEAADEEPEVEIETFLQEERFDPLFEGEPARTSMDEEPLIESREPVSSLFREEIRGKKEEPFFQETQPFPFEGAKKDADLAERISGLTKHLSKIAESLAVLQGSVNSLKNEIAVVKYDIARLRPQAPSAGDAKETEEMKEIRKEQKDMRSILIDIRKTLDSLREKKRWFRF
jgi:signal recognition particle receptor subunit beta